MTKKQYTQTEISDLARQIKEKVGVPEWVNMVGDFAEKRLARIIKAEQKAAFQEDTVATAVVPGELYMQLVNAIGEQETYKLIEDFLNVKLQGLPKILQSDPHPHAEKMKEYANDATKHRYPWKLWSFRNPQNNNSSWQDLQDHPEWNTYREYRRKH